MKNILAQKAVIKQILFIAIPVIIGNLLQIAYQMTDLFWLGKVGTNEIAAIAISMPLLFVFLSVGIGISIAGMILISQRYGQKQTSKINGVTGQLVLVMTILGIISGLIGYFLTPTLINLSHAEDVVKELAIQYLQISFIGMVFLYGLFAVKDSLAGVQEFILPLKITCTTVILNLFLDPLLIIYFDFGIKGAAYATIITQALAFFIGLYVLVKGNHKIKLTFKTLKPHKRRITNIFKLGIPSTIELSAISLSGLALITIVSTYSTAITAAYGIGIEIFNIVIFISVGVLVAASTLVGQAIGENNKEKAKEIGKLATILTIIINIIITILTLIFAKQIMLAFTTDPLVITAGITLLQILALTFVFFGIEKTFTGVLQGSGNPHLPTYVVILALWIIQIPLAYYLSNYTQLKEIGVWLSIVIGGFIGALLMIIIFFKYPWAEKSIVKDEEE